MKSLKTLLLVLFTLFVVSVSADGDGKQRRKIARQKSYATLLKIYNIKYKSQFGKITRFFYPKDIRTFDDKGLPELGDYKFTKNSEDGIKLDNTLERKRNEADQKSKANNNDSVTIKGCTKKKSEWEKYFWNSDFGEGTQVKEAQDEWKKTKSQTNSINRVAPPPKRKKKEGENDTQYKQRLASQEKKYRDQIRAIGNEQVNDYLDLLEAKEKEEGVMRQSAEKVKQVAEENELLGLNKLAKKFEDCIDCKI